MTRSRLLQNTGANMAGRLVSAGSNLVAAPIIIHAIGREGFGVVTFALSLMAFSSLLDLGLAATANRALAQTSATGRNSAEQADLLRTFELIYWAGAAVIIVAAVAASGWVARDWLNLTTLRSSDAAFVVALIGIMLGLRFPVGLYTGVLYGRLRHVEKNVIFGGFSAVQSLGGAALVVFVSPSVLLYSKWLVLTGVGEMLVTALAAWGALGGRRSFVLGRFKKAILAQHWQFSLIFAATGAICSLGAASDRFLLGKLLPVGEVGLYGLLYTPAGVLIMISGALSVAAFPEFAATSLASGQSAASSLFVRAQSLATVCILVIAIPLATQYAPVLRIWTHDSAIARDGFVPGVFLIAAMAVNALANPAYTFLLGSGRLRLALMCNVAGLAITVASLFLLVPRLGLAGAAIAVLISNAFGLVFFLFQARKILDLTGARAAVGRACFLACSLCVCNFAIAVTCHLDSVRVALSIFTSGAIGCLFCKKTGLLQQFLDHPQAG